MLHPQNNFSDNSSSSSSSSSASSSLAQPTSSQPRQADGLVQNDTTRTKEKKKKDRLRRLAARLSRAISSKPPPSSSFVTDHTSSLPNSIIHSSLQSKVTCEKFSSGLLNKSVCKRCGFSKKEHERDSNQSFHHTRTSISPSNSTSASTCSSVSTNNHPVLGSHYNTNTHSIATSHNNNNNNNKNTPANNKRVDAFASAMASASASASSSPDMATRDLLIKQQVEQKMQRRDQVLGINAVQGQPGCQPPAIQIPVCDNYSSHVWKKDMCARCFHPKQSHKLSAEAQQRESEEERMQRVVFMNQLEKDRVSKLLASSSVPAMTNANSNATTIAFVTANAKANAPNLPNPYFTCVKSAIVPTRLVNPTRETSNGTLGITVPSA